MKRAIIAFVALMSLAAPAYAWGTTTITDDKLNISCAVGGKASMVNGDLSIPSSPINIGSNGQMAHVRGSCDVSKGNLFVGAIAEYGMVMGDLNDIGVNREGSLAARVGVRFNQTKVYALGGYARTWLNGGDLDAWQLGGGIEVAIPDTPLVLGMEARRSFYQDVPFGLDLTSDSVGVFLMVKLN